MNKPTSAPHPLAFLSLLAGAAAIAFAPIFVRLSDVSPVASAFWRVALAVPLLWIWAFASREPSTSPTLSHASLRTPLKAALLAGVCFACDLGAWHVSLTWTSVANATLESNFAPVFVTLGAWLLWKQRPNLKFMTALAATLTGAVLIIVPNAAVSRVALAGDMLGVLTAVFYAGYMLAIKRATGQMPVARLMAISATTTAATLLPLASGPAPERLALVAPGVAFAALALASLLSLERLFERDYEDGALDLLALGPLPLEAVAAVKCVAQWLATGAPLALLAPVIAIALGADPKLAPLIFTTSLAAGLGFAFVGRLGASLALGARRGGVLVAVIVLPLFTPLVVFGAGAVDAFASGLDWKTGLIFLFAYCLAAASLSPFAMAAACRNALS